MEGDIPHVPEVPMNRVTRIAAGAAVALAVVAGGVTYAVAQDGNDDDDNEVERRITGDALEQASSAALDHTGGGRVTDTEVGDEESHYEIEVTLDDGGQVDVQLDEEFRVVGDETDPDGTDDD
jgi:uncharacterized membrane protein YkoI